MQPVSAVKAAADPAEAPARQAPAPEAAADEAPARPSPAAVAPAAPTPAPRERSAAAAGPTGVWIDHTGRGAVEITECAGGLCGRIVWLKDAGHGSVCGTQVIGNAKRTAAGTWDGGWIYDPDKKARYSVELKSIGADKLRVVGYLGSKMFSETMTWKRAAGDLKRCDQPAPKVAAEATPAPAAEKPAEQKPEEMPAQDKEPGSPPASKGAMPGKLNMATLEKLAREMVQVDERKGKSGRQMCSATLPYVGRVTVPCP
jgi:uncharacterized protein (DUF2147 family)